MSVIFHDGRGGKDSHRLKFMAEKTVESAPLDDKAAGTMLDLRHHEIDQVAEMLRSSTCFRSAIRSYFGQAGNQGARRTLSERILDWVFGSRSKQVRHSACCDSCDAQWIKKHGRLQYIGTNVSDKVNAQRPPSRQYLHC